MFFKHYIDSNFNFALHYITYELKGFKDFNWDNFKADLYTWEAGKEAELIDNDVSYILHPSLF